MKFGTCGKLATYHLLTGRFSQLKVYKSCFETDSDVLSTFFRCWGSLWCHCDSHKSGHCDADVTVTVTSQWLMPKHEEMLALICFHPLYTWNCKNWSSAASLVWICASASALVTVCVRQLARHKSCSNGPIFTIQIVKQLFWHHWWHFWCFCGMWGYCDIIMTVIVTDIVTSHMTVTMASQWLMWHHIDLWYRCENLRKSQD